MSDEVPDVYIPDSWPTSWGPKDIEAYMKQKIAERERALSRLAARATQATLDALAADDAEAQRQEALAFLAKIGVDPNSPAGINYIADQTVFKNRPRESAGLRKVLGQGFQSYVDQLQGQPQQAPAQPEPTPSAIRNVHGNDLWTLAEMQKRQRKATK